MTIITINRTTSAQPPPANSTRTTDKSFSHNTELNPARPPNPAIQESAKTGTTPETLHSIKLVTTNNSYQDALKNRQQPTNYSLSYAIQSYNEHHDFEKKENIQQLFGVDVFA